MPTHVVHTPGLVHLGEKLRQHGFVTVDPEDNVHTPAALIYSLHEAHTLSQVEVIQV